MVRKDMKTESIEEVGSHRTIYAETQINKKVRTQRTKDVRT